MPITPPSGWPRRGRSLDRFGGASTEPARGARHSAEPRDDVERLAGRDQPFELGQLLLQPGRIDRTPCAAENLRVRGRHGLLAVAPKLFVKLLARPHADELHFDVASGLLAGKANHVMREVDDLYGLSHVEDVDVAALSDRAGLDDELDGLRDRHEEAGHLRVRHGDGAAARDLAAKERDDASG